MTINASDFRTDVITPALAALVPAGIPYSLVAEDLLMATAAVESGLGSRLVQLGGPALGVFQIEPATVQDLYTRLTAPQLVAVKRATMPQWSVLTQLPANLLLAAELCRLVYWHDPMPLPPRTDTGLWSMYKSV